MTMQYRRRKRRNPLQFLVDLAFDIWDTIW